MITQQEAGGAAAQGDGVVRALLTAVATLELLASQGHDAHVALSTLEGIAHELDSMGPDGHRQFVAALERIAADDPYQAAWVRGLPDALGLDR
ncbi:hypothetical protein ACFW1A_38780 [Kitasatospora sp. NPDC058965]|uniref:hypothetical protein n=1 Tax=Kitasatospora sp. NPDC058965 TaxID=3346682 RepID=UPI0036A9E54E